MAVDSMRSTGAISPDPDLGMGRRLAALERRKYWLFQAKVALVWLGLVAILGLALTAVNVEAGYMWRNLDDVLGSVLLRLESRGLVLVVKGVFVTIFISLISVVIAAILALFGALGRLSTNSIAQGISGFYVTVFRGTPLLVQMYLIYLGLPQIGLSLKALGLTFLGDLLILDAIPTGILALSLNYGAYMTEIFRAGLQSIGHGQAEAALALGMTRTQTLRRVILPQSIRIIIPDVGNQFISMQKDSSLVSIFGIFEVTFLANQAGNRQSQFMEMFLVAAGIYLVLTIVSSWLQGRLEQRMAHAYER